MSNGLRTRWKQRLGALQQMAAGAEDWLAGRSPRERVMVFAGGFMAVALIWQMALLSPQSSRLTSLQSEQETLESQMDGLRSTIAALEEQTEDVEDPDQTVRERIASLESQIEAIRAGESRRDLAFITLMPAEEAIDRIGSAIKSEPAPRIIGFDRQPGAGIAVGSDDRTTNVAIDHRRMRLTVEADYAQTVALLARLEALTVPLVWRSMDYEVSDHPMARVTLRFDIYAAAQVD
ncbi:hypothetical protein SPICUR_04135 [Spiribacter curvatus]|uniref:MSHA biogenesis protein MshJ n=1 Tax=Spiribacter curvatus TaxID=1335757 RepID=U5T3G6_9GAMM|nr:type II secretion system protein GspM [Spiribacter curvatus]AGY91811.1 hypothetical protein SPICUR_04135 [Spiribacter curvatus]